MLEDKHLTAIVRGAVYKNENVEEVKRKITADENNLYIFDIDISQKKYYPADLQFISDRINLLKTNEPSKLDELLEVVLKYIFESKANSKDKRDDGKEWKEYGSNLIDYYVLRKVIYDKKIPLIQKQDIIDKHGRHYKYY